MSVELAPSRSLSPSLLKRASSYLLAACLSLACALFVLKLSDPALLSTPLYYIGDETFVALTIKSVVTTGWYLTNPMAGAPDGHTLVDFPTPETLNYLIIKLISLFTPNWVLIHNLFYLLTFPLITLTALFVMKHLGLRTPFAVASSVLFALLPYHFMRSTGHLFLAAYYTPPLAIWLSLLIYKDHLISEGKAKILKLIPYLGVCILVGSTGVYYAYFGCFFLVIAGLIASHRIKKLRPLKYAILFIFVITGSVLVNILPTLTFHYKYGSNPLIAHREIGETELYGLKISQLLLPIDNDRIQPLAKIKQKYNHHNPSNENTMATLGLIGSVGFFVLLARCFQTKKEEELRMDALSHFNLSALLLSTVGGLSSIVSLLLLRDIRCYNRISVFLAFFALSAFFLTLQKLFEKRQIKNTWIWCVFFITLGLFNQTTPKFSAENNFKNRKALFNRDKLFFGKIDQILPPDSMVFQLPYLSFPESYHPRMHSYDHFRAPLHSKHLKWSFGAARGRGTDRWQKQTAALPLHEMLKELASMGFSGIYLNKEAYSDLGEKINLELAELLHVNPIENENASFWDLRPFIESLKSTEPTELWQTRPRIVDQRAY